MLSLQNKLPLRSLALLCLLLTFAVLLHTGLNQDRPTPGPSLFDYVLRTSPPPGVAIELSAAQLSELEAAYTDGFRNPNPDDPCERIRLLPHKQLSKWRRQFSRRGFTVERVRRMLRSGQRVPHTHPTKGTTYTRILDTDGSCLIIDLVDCVIWQVAPANFRF